MQNTKGDCPGAWPACATQTVRDLPLRGQTSDSNLDTTSQKYGQHSQPHRYEQYLPTTCIKLDVKDWEGTLCVFRPGILTQNSSLCLFPPLLNHSQFIRPPMSYFVITPAHFPICSPYSCLFIFFLIVFPKKHRLAGFSGSDASMQLIDSCNLTTLILLLERTASFPPEAPWSLFCLVFLPLCSLFFIFELYYVARMSV